MSFWSALGNVAQTVLSFTPIGPVIGAFQTANALGNMDETMQQAYDEQMAQFQPVLDNFNGQLGQLEQQYGLDPNATGYNPYGTYTGPNLPGLNGQPGGNGTQSGGPRYVLV